MNDKIRVKINDDGITAKEMNNKYGDNPPRRDHFFEWFTTYDERIKKWQQEEEKMRVFIIDRNYTPEDCRLLTIQIEHGFLAFDYSQLKYSEQYAEILPNGKIKIISSKK